MSVSVSLTPEVLAELDSRDRYASRSAKIERAVRAWLDKEAEPE